MTRALVLSGGGPVGIGWEAGVVAGLTAQGVDAGLADYILGTSAGSVVGAQVASGRDVAEVTERMQADSSARSSRAPVGASGEKMQSLMKAFMDLFTSTESDEVKRAKIGKFALEAETMPEERFIANFGHLADAGWPRRYACTAVDAEAGEFVVWDEGSGAPLERCVVSSCAVPGIFPPITINGRRYVDGGMRSATNADLAKGPDSDAASAMGINLMDPSMVTQAAEAGERQRQTNRRSAG